MQESRAWIKQNAQFYIKSLLNVQDQYSISDYDEIVVNRIHLTGAVADIARFGPSPKSPESTPETRRRTAQLLRQLEAAVGRDNLVLVDSRAAPERVESTIKKFINTHS